MMLYSILIKIVKYLKKGYIVIKNFHDIIMLHKYSVFNKYKRYNHLFNS